MGRYDLRPLRVRQTASLIMAAKRQPPPPWFQAMGDVPPPEILTRTLPVRHRPPPISGRRKVRKPSKMFIPQSISYEEDKLRSEFFKDHPWELARPRVLLEDGGKDHQRWDWSKASEPGRPSGGESVIHRQRYLMQVNIGPLTRYKIQQLGENPSKEARDRAADLAVEEARDQAYDQARKELYDQRHDAEIEIRVAREEATAVGALFGLSQNEIGMQVENRTFDNWRRWAETQVVTMEQARAGAYSGGAGSQGGATTKDEGVEQTSGQQGSAVLDELERTLPGKQKITASKTGTQAFGGAATMPGAG